MRVAVPHTVGRAEARRRLQARAHEVAGFIPGGMADVAVTWPGEDRMAMRIAALGQEVTGMIEVEDAQVVFNVTLPPALSFVEPAIRSAVEANGRKLLG
ncbi:MAG: polyhydroxyalkanoic acid system family protein [Sphingomonadales bacterium]|nr:polyhydroxyalkanoic acid system family protein [Sphingomonadales bacterium]